MKHCLLLKPKRETNLRHGIVKIENVLSACVIMGEKPPYPLRLKVFTSDGKVTMYQPDLYKYKWLY